MKKVHRGPWANGRKFANWQRVVMIKCDDYFITKKRICYVTLLDYLKTISKELGPPSLEFLVRSCSHHHITGRYKNQQWWEPGFPSTVRLFFSGSTEPSRCNLNDEVEPGEREEEKWVNCWISLIAIKPDALSLWLRRNSLQFLEVISNLWLTFGYVKQTMLISFQDLWIRRMTCACAVACFFFSFSDTCVSPTPMHI